MRFTLLGLAAFATLLTSFALFLFGSKHWKNAPWKGNFYMVMFFRAASAIVISHIFKYREAIHGYVANPASYLLRLMGDLLGVFLTIMSGNGFEGQDVVQEFWTTFLFGVAFICLLELIWPSTDLGLGSLAAKILLQRSHKLSDQYELVKMFGIFAGMMLLWMRYYFESKRQVDAREET